MITRPVATLKEGAAAIGDGNLDFRVTIQSGDEFEDLARSFNTMAEALKENIANLKKTTAEKERYAKEMEIARSIQTSFLPETMPEIPGFDISAVMIPAMEVGGDFYDVVPVSDGRWAFVIADVSGKGVSAALFMAMSRTLIRAGLEGATDTSGALCTANHLIARSAPSSMFVTVFSAILDPGKLTLACTNAGHNPPLVVRGDSGEAVFLQEHGVAMGVLPDMDGTPEVRAAETRGPGHHVYRRGNGSFRCRVYRIRGRPAGSRRTGMPYPPRRCDPGSDHRGNPGIYRHRTPV